MQSDLPTWGEGIIMIQNKIVQNGSDIFNKMMLGGDCYPYEIYSKFKNVIPLTLLIMVKKMYATMNYTDINM